MGKIKRSFTMGGGKATLACLILIVTALAFTGCEQPDGTPDDESQIWEIYTADDLLAWNAYVMKNTGTSDKPEYPNLGTDATLMADISLEESWTPVGYYDSEARVEYCYAGTFDGNGYTISNLTIISENTAFVGLFGYVGENGAVNNLTLSSDVEISGPVGGIAGYNYGKIENCSVSGTVSSSLIVGGIAGYNFGTIENCSVSETVSSPLIVGGIACYNYGTIENCSISGTVSGETNGGGIAGVNVGTIKNCSVLGNVSGSGSEYVGGIAGYNWEGIIENCSVSGTVNGSDWHVGGIAGQNGEGTIKNCNVSGTVSGSSYSVGGIAGRNNSGTIENCSVSGTVSGSSYSVGGITGDNYGTIIACYNTGDIGDIEMSSTYVGGIVGYNSNNDSNNGTIRACYNTGNVSGTRSVGGVVGYNDATVNACFWKESSANQGIGDNQGSGSAPEVDGNYVTWETARDEMNDALSEYGYDYKYTRNDDPSTKDTIPLIIVKPSN